MDDQSGESEEEEVMDEGLGEWEMEELVPEWGWWRDRGCEIGQLFITFTCTVEMLIFF